MRLTKRQLHRDSTTSERLLKPENIFNIDETGYFYKVLPNKGYVQEGKGKCVRGTKNTKFKNRVTMYVCTNEKGYKIPLAMIGKSKNPRRFNQKKPPMKYCNQRKAWYDTPTMLQWCHFFLVEVCKYKKYIVPLIMDNYGPHGVELEDPTGKSDF